MYAFFEFDYENVSFEWDDEKAARNFEKHGIRFETAIKVFADDNKLIRLDEEHVSEERYNILGKVGKVLFVVCAFKTEDRVRIISARPATVREKRRYEYGDSYDE
ncbi:MAG: BrnT family toxin [Lachnospiraceae bacterium]|nr:BrnT family toxin [Lachnospiraceae bacterium]